MECPACGSEQRRSGNRIAVCGRCGHRWLAHAEDEHRAIEQATYTDEYQGYREDPRFAERTRSFIHQELLPRVPAPARLLDVGCGAGAFMAVARDAGYAVQGIDISEASARICRDAGLNARAGDFLTEQFDGPFDVITMWDVVEHLNRPASFLARARELLTDNGLLLAKIPGFGDLSVRIASTTPKAASILLGAPAHVQFFDRESLSALLRREGYNFEFLDWGAIRTPPSGGSLKRRLARRICGTISTASGDEQLYVLARASE